MMTSKENGCAMIRVTSYTDYDCLTSFRSYLDENNRKNYDKNIERSYITDTLGTNLFTQYQATNRVVTVASRDFHAFSFGNAYPDGSIKCVMWDIDRPDTNGKVRMDAPLAGFHFNPMEGDNTKTKISLFIEA